MIRLHRDALLAYGGWPEDDANECAVLPACRLLEDLAEHVCQASGRRCELTEPDELDEAARRPLVRWAPGPDHRVVAVSADVVSGRRIVSGPRDGAGRQG